MQARLARRRRCLVAALAGAVLGLAGCSGGSAPHTSGGPSAETPATSTTPGPSASPTPTLATLPAAQCLRGTWNLVRFVGASNQTYGTGEGGDVTVRFTDGAYSLSGAGAKPVAVTLGGATADLRVDGHASGTYRLRGSTATFSQKSTSGSGTVQLGGRSQRLTMKQVTSVVGLQGGGTVACTASAMTITLSTVRLELGRT